MRLYVTEGKKEKVSQTTQPTAPMTKEEKLKLIQALDEAERRAKKKRGIFKPHLGQRAVFACDKPIKIVTCGNGWGKSTFACNLIYNRAKGVDPWGPGATESSPALSKVPCKIIVLLDNPSKILDVYRAEYSKWHDMDEIEELRHGSPYVKEWRYKNGSSVRFLTQEMDQLVFESIQFDVLIIDEICPRQQYIGLTRGQRAKGVTFEQYIIGTPISNDHAWVRQDFIEPWKEDKRPNVECFMGSTNDNKENLDDGYVERFESLLTEKEKRTRIYGEFSSAEGLAFGHLISGAKHQVSAEGVSWDYSWPCVVGIDPHPSKAHVAVMVGRRPYDDKLFVLKELSLKCVAREFASNLLAWTAGYRVVDWVCDSLGAGDSTGHDGFKSFIDVLKSCGVRARSTTFDEKLHEDAVNRIREMLAIEDDVDPNWGEPDVPRLRFLSGATDKTLYELKNISWLYDKRKELNRPRLDSAKLDYYSALTYALSSGSLARSPIHARARAARAEGHGEYREARRVQQSLTQGLGLLTSKGNTLQSSRIEKSKMKRYYTNDYIKARRSR